MKWITALALERWALKIGTRQAFPALIADMIRATSSHINAFRFPSRDKAQVRGFDGSLVTETEVAPYVPGGRSIWEFGVNQGAAAKADADFKKRTDSLEEADRLDTTFVFVSPWTWDNPQKKLDKMVSEWRGRKSWKDVRYIDGAMLEDWLERCPAVAARYARYELGIAPPLGVLSTDEFWEIYSSRFAPPLTEDVLLCDREDQRNAFVQWISSEKKGKIAFAADSTEEVIAFAVASIRKADLETKAYIESRALVIDTEDCARQLGEEENRGRIFLPRHQASRSAGWLAQRGPTLVAMSGNEPRRSEVLPRPTRSSMSKALITMGMTDERANALARECGCSVTILSRRIAAGSQEPPEWHDRGAALLPAVLAGAWKTGSEYDKQILGELAGRDYALWEADLRPLERLSDPPIDRVDDVWQVRAPVDAFCWLAVHIGEEELRRLREVAFKVLSHVEEPPASTDTFVIGRPSRHGPSPWLRSGLANTLLIIAALHDEARLYVPRSTPQEFVDEIVSRLPAYAQDPRLLVDLGEDLIRLAEASPDPFVLALERGLEGHKELMKGIFEEVENPLFPNSRYPYLLWALEVLAWEPTLLSRVSLILARLAEIDPGGRLSNRPINSLRAIFLPWAPNTFADLSTKLAVIDTIIAELPTIAWKLLTELLPRAFGMSRPNAKPRFRVSTAESTDLTYGVVWENQRKIVSRVLSLVGQDVERLCVVIERMEAFEPGLRRQSLETIDRFLKESQGEERYRVWCVLRDQLHRHRAHPNVSWVMPPDELAEIDVVVSRNAPSDLLVKVRWLFDEWLPDMPGTADEQEALIEQERQRVLLEIFREQNIDGVLKLVAAVKLPRLVGFELPKILPDIVASEDALIRATRQRKDGQDGFVAAFSSASFRRFGQEWMTRLAALALANTWGPFLTVCALSGLPERRDTWTAVTGFGATVEQMFWREKQAFPPADPASDLEYAVGKYLEVGRASAALAASSGKLQFLTVDLILRILDDLVPEINACGKVGGMISHQLGRVFKHLHSRDGVEVMDVARREYVFLPLLDDSLSMLRLHGVLVENPEFYVSILREVYRPEGEDDRTVGEAEIVRARLGYKLLASFKTLPGSNDGEIDRVKLEAWITSVRRLAAESKRGTIADLYIGHLLAHAPSDRDDSAWPARSVREILERLSADEVERGVAVERHNMRGLYSKDLHEGGAQERTLAERYREWASRMPAFPRTAKMLASIASDWDRKAAREDIRASQNKLRERQ